MRDSDSDIFKFLQKSSADAATAYDKATQEAATKAAATAQPATIVVNGVAVEKGAIPADVREEIVAKAVAGGMDVAKAREALGLPALTTAPVVKAAEKVVVLKAATMSAKAALVAEKGLIYGIGGGANLDLDNEKWSQKSMIDMAHDFTSSDSQVFKANHAEEVACKLVESCLGRPVLKSGLVLKVGDSIPEADEVIGFDAMADPTHWLVGVQPTSPAMIEAAKAGKVKGFSWAGFVEKTPVAA